MATIVPAPRQVDLGIGNVLSLYGMKQQKDIADRRADISDEYNKQLTRRIDMEDTEARRQMDVAKARGDTATADILSQQAESNKLLTPEQRVDRLMVDVTRAETTKENNNLRTMVQAQQSQLGLANQQMNFMQFQNRISSDAETKWEAAGPEMASAIGDIKKQLLTTQDPNEKSALFDRYNVLQDKGMQMIADSKKEALATTKESGQYGKFSANLYNDMRPDVASRARIAERDKEKIDLRVLAAGEYIGGKPGASKIPFTKKSFIYDKIEALKEGYTEEEWDAAGSLSNDKSTAAQDAINAELDKKKSKATKEKAPTTLQELNRMMQANPSESKRLYDTYISKVK